MVRVISCHHFVSQDVFLSEHEPSALGCAQGKLLFATAQHTVEVHDLDARGNILHSFPTVDLVKQLVYCDIGNYIATLEYKLSRHSEQVTFVRVYFNWWVESKGQPMKVRIAGCPASTEQHETGSFEMVELPLEQTALSIVCCKRTACLAVSLGKCISLFCFHAKTHDTLKYKFYDFDHFLNIQMNFIVDEVNMCEGYFACLAANQIQVFKVYFGKQDSDCVFPDHRRANSINSRADSLNSRSDSLNSRSDSKNPRSDSLNSRSDSKNSRADSLNSRSDSKNSRADSQNSRASSRNSSLGSASCKTKETHCLEWKFESCEASGTSHGENNDQIKSYLDSHSFPLSIRLPAVERAKENDSSSGNFEIHGPLLTGRGHDIEIKIDPKIYEICPTLVSMSITCYTLLHKQIQKTETQSGLFGLHLVPVYQCDYLLNECSDPLNEASSVSERELFSLPWSPLTSNLYSYLKSMCCFFTTSKEGFLYDITSAVKMLSSYPYTAPLKSIVLEPTLLHALTDAGLETYTLCVGHSAIQHAEDLDQLRNASPSCEESVCLLGLRPFLGVDQLVMCENYIVLVSSTDDSLSNSGSSGNGSFTLYSLKRPSPEQMFADLLEVGQFHKNSSPPTYIHLLSEAHMILRTNLFISKHNQLFLRELYEKSCTMMADYFLCSDVASDKPLAVPYYYMGKLPVEMVIQRILEFHHQGKHGGILKILVRYLNLMLLTKPHSSLSLPQATAEAILDIYAEDAPEQLWKIILLSGLQGYRLEKAILILKRRITGKHNHSSAICNAYDTVAIVVLLLQKGNCDAAQSMILSVSKVDLLHVLVDVCELIWTDDHLSSFGQFIKQVRPDILLELFLNLTEKGKLQMDNVIQFLKKDSPSADAFAVPLLKEFLEIYISGKKFCAEKNTFCIILLVDIYLNRLKEARKSSSKSYTSLTNASKSAFLFGPRAPWLDEMPPFNGRGISKTCTNNKCQNGDSYCTCWSCNEDLLKLQSLLTWQHFTTAVSEHVMAFLKSLKMRIRGQASLEVMCSKESQALSLLLKVCPAAVLSYAHHNFGKNNENWYLLFSLITHQMEYCTKDNEDICQMYQQIFHGVLNHVSEILEPTVLISLIQDCQSLKLTSLSHIKRCCEKQQAEQLKNKIVSLGKEIKDMM